METIQLKNRASRKTYTKLGLAMFAASLVIVGYIFKSSITGFLHNHHLLSPEYITAFIILMIIVVFPTLGGIFLKDSKPADKTSQNINSFSRRRKLIEQRKKRISSTIIKPGSNNIYF